MYTGTLFLFIAAQYSTEWTYNTLFIHSLRYYSGCFQRFIIMITKAQVFQLCSRLFEPLWVLCISTQNFKNILPISTKACWDYDWNYFGISFQFSGNWQCDNVHFPIHEHGLPLYSFRVFLFLSFFFPTRTRALRWDPWTGRCRLGARPETTQLATKLSPKVYRSALHGDHPGTYFYFSKKYFNREIFSIIQ